MPDPRQSRNVSKNGKRRSVKAGAVDEPAVNTASSGQTTHVSINMMPPGTQLKLTFSGVGDIRIGELQLSIPGIGAPPYLPDSQVLRFAENASGPVMDTRTPELRIREFEQERCRVIPYILDYGSRSYPTRRAV